MTDLERINSHELYPGQAYFHAVSPVIRRAEETWMDNELRAKLVEAIGKLDAQEMRRETGEQIKGEHWIRRDEVVELIQRWEEK